MEVIKRKLNDNEKEKRTLSQNASMHLWLTQLAEQFNRRGITLKAVVSRLDEAECQVTKENLKEAVIKPIARALYGKDSTTQLNKIGELDQIWDVINKWVSEQWKGEIEVPPFPSVEENK